MKNGFYIDVKASHYNYEVCIVKVIDGRVYNLDNYSDNTFKLELDEHPNLDLIPLEEVEIYERDKD